MMETGLPLFTTPVRQRRKQQQSSGKNEEETQELVRSGLNHTFLRTQRQNSVFESTIGMRLCEGHNYQVQFNKQPKLLHEWGI